MLIKQKYKYLFLIKITSFNIESIKLDDIK